MIQGKLLHTRLLYSISTDFCGDLLFLRENLSSDWLFVSWLMFICTLLWFLGSAFYLIVGIRTLNSRQMYVYSTSVGDSLLYLVGCMYYLRGSYDEIIMGNVMTSIQSGPPNLDSSPGSAQLSEMCISTGLNVFEERHENDKMAT